MNAALPNPKFIEECSKIFGKQAVVIAIDYKYINNKPKVFENNGTKITDEDPLEWAKFISKKGVGEIIFTNIDNEGTKRGIDNSYEYIKSCCAKSIERLNNEHNKVDYIDLYYLHRLTGEAQVDEAMQAMAELLGTDLINIPD